MNFQGGGSDLNGALSHAQQHGSGGANEEGMFSSVLGRLQGNTPQGGVDEQAMVGAHERMYGGGGGGGGQQHGSETVGAGAAMQALKMFTGGGGGGGGGTMGGGGGGGGGGQNALVGMAMGQASKLFDQQSAQGRLVGCCVLPSPLFVFMYAMLTMGDWYRIPQPTRSLRSRRRARWR